MLSVEDCVFDNLHGCVYCVYHFPGVQTRTVVLVGEEERLKSGDVVP